MDREPLQCNDRGPWELMVDRPNPHGLVLVFAPSIEEVLDQVERRIGRHLSGLEIDRIRAKASVVAIEAETAETLEDQRIDRLYDH